VSHSSLARIVILALLPFIFLPQLAAAQNDTGAVSRPAPTTATVPVSQLLTEPRHIVRNLAQRGISFQGLFVEDWSKEWNDSNAPASGFGRYSLDLTVAMDGEKVLGWKGSTASVRLKQHINEFGDGDGIAAQLYSNIDACSKTMLYELWLEQKLFGEKLRLKGGKIDANSEFAVVEGAGDFLNSSMGYSPTIVAFPTYPEPKLGFGIFVHPTKNNAINLGVFQTAGWGTLSVVEPGRRWSTRGDLPGRVSVGYWRLDGEMSRMDGSRTSTTQGVYSVLEQSLWHHPLAGKDADRALSTFLQFGKSNSSVSAFGSHVGGGVVLQAPIANRPHDSLGVAATRVSLSPCPGESPNPAAELILESYYKIALSQHFAFVQDLQYLHQPGALSTNPDGPVASSRLVVSF
jgi:porin